jgi:hypothetical protein
MKQKTGYILLRQLWLLHWDHNNEIKSINHKDHKGFAQRSQRAEEHYFNYVYFVVKKVQLNILNFDIQAMSSFIK